MSETDGETVAASTSTVIGNRADAFGLVTWFAHELANRFSMMVERDLRVDVTIEFREQEQVGE